MKVPFYRWSDGTTAWLCGDRSGWDLSVSAQSEVHGRFIVAFSFNDRYPRTMRLEQPISANQFWDKIVGTKLPAQLCGLLLDLGVERHAPSTGLVEADMGPSSSLHPSVVHYPRFVSEEEWGQRYDLARSFAARRFPRGVDLPDTVKDGTFIGSIERFHVVYYNSSDEPYWYAVWSEGLGKAEGQTLESVVDQVLAHEIVLPFSQREAWEEQNVERGKFLLFDQEEVELYRMLGEPLPCFWGKVRFSEWLTQREVG